MRVEQFQSSLHARASSFNRRGEVAASQFVLVHDGHAEAEQAQERFSFSGPAILWLADGEPGRLRLDAGATGYRAAIPSDLLISAIGEEPEAVELRFLMSRSFTLSLAGKPDAEQTLQRCFAGLLAEYRQPARGSGLLLSALVRIMLVRILRMTEDDHAQLLTGVEKSGTLQRFRQLVELNFRHHWSVARYAQELGVSTDRLHAICRSATGRPPKTLIQERLAREAALRLERTALSVQQLAHSLGYNDPAHFSNFFRRITGVTPGDYRRRVAMRSAEDPAANTASFADWP
jgi:AraC family transcriptional regulator, transcriptional activator of pobA